MVADLVRALAQTTVHMVMLEALVPVVAAAALAMGTTAVVMPLKPLTRLYLFTLLH